MTKAEIQFVRSLADKRMRDSEGLFIDEGDKLVEEIIASGLNIRNLYTTNKGLGLRGATLIERSEMERISQLKSANTTLAVVEQPRYKLDERALRDTLILALDGVQNPGNMGTIICLADWFGIKDVLCSTECADCYNPKVVQATMGAILRVRVHYVDDLAKLLNRLNSSGMPIYGTLLDGQNIYTKQLSTNGVIVMGNEGNGIGNECGRHITERLLIPNYPMGRETSESLNVSVATAIICSEFRRRS